MTINVINLDPWQPCRSIEQSITEDFIRRSREERALSICKQSKEQGFAVRFWEGLIEKQSMSGIKKSPIKKILNFLRRFLTNGTLLQKMQLTEFYVKE